MPYFIKLLKEGCTKLPVTHKDATRFWISLDQGVEFVISMLDEMRGGRFLFRKFLR